MDRYTIDRCCDGCSMSRDPEGGWVEIDEVEALRARVAELEKNNADLLCDREVADRYASLLATAIAAHFREDIGEHSDTNNPWDNALNLIEGTFCR